MERKQAFSLWHFEEPRVAPLLNTKRVAFSRADAPFAAAGREQAVEPRQP